MSKYAPEENLIKRIAYLGSMIGGSYGLRDRSRRKPRDLGRSSTG